MEASPAKFDHVESAKRIQEILAIPDSAFEERDSIPSRDLLTFENGFYVACTALFIDLRGSKKHAEKYKMPALARFNRIFISELVSVLRDNDGVREMFIEGDCVWAVYDTTTTSAIDSVFQRSYSAVSLINIANHYLAKRGYERISIGAGLAYGRALMIKAGSKGSGINEIVWTGKVVGEAAQLCSYGNRTYSDRTIMVSDSVRVNLNSHYQGFLTWNVSRACWHGDVERIDMQQWLREQQ